MFVVHGTQATETFALKQSNMINRISLLIQHTDGHDYFFYMRAQRASAEYISFHARHLLTLLYRQTRGR